MKVLFSLFVLTLVVTAFAENEKIGYSYTLWIGDDASEKHFIHLNSDAGIKFVDGMDQAAAIKPEFAYEAKVYSFGKFITKIAGKSQDPSSNLYWMFYELPQVPNCQKKPGDEFLTQLGVSSLEVKDKKHYLFWLRTVNWH